MNISLKHLWSCAPEGHSFFYWRLNGKWILYLLFLLSFCLSLTGRADENRTTSAPTWKCDELLSTTSCWQPSSSVASSLSTSHTPSSSLCFCLAGRCFAFRGERGNDEPPIEMIKVSHLKWVFSARAGWILSAGITCTCVRGQLYSYTVNTHTHTNKPDKVGKQPCLPWFFFLLLWNFIYVWIYIFFSTSNIKLLLSIDKVLLHPDLILKHSENTHFIQLPLAHCQLELLLNTFLDLSFFLGTFLYYDVKNMIQTF